MKKFIFPDHTVYSDDTISRRIDIGPKADRVSVVLHVNRDSNLVVAADRLINRDYGSHWRSAALDNSLVIKAVARAGLRRKQREVDHG